MEAQLASCRDVVLSKPIPTGGHGWFLPFDKSLAGSGGMGVKNCRQRPFKISVFDLLTHVDSCLELSTHVDRRGPFSVLGGCSWGQERGFLGAERVSFECL